MGFASAGCSFYHSLLPHHHRHMISSSSTTTTCSCTALTLYHIVRRPPYLLLSNTTPPSPRRPRNRLLLFPRAFADTSPAADADADDDDDEALVTRQLQQLADSLNSQTPPAGIPPDSATSSYAHMSTASRPVFLPHQSSCDQPFNYPDGAGDVSASVELKANSVCHLPLSLQMIKRKKKHQQQQLLLLGNPTACCSSSSSSVKRAFSSMVFIIRELQSYTLHLLRENLREGILNRVQGEMHASFVWLFQHIFACTPTLMLSLMLLLANFTAHSMMAHAATPTPQYPSAVVATASAAASATATDGSHHTIDKTSAVERASIGGGGRKSCRPVAGSTDDGRPIMFLPKGIMSTAPATADDDALIVVAREEEKEANLWNEIVEEARRMQAACRDEALMEPEILQRLVSPVAVEMEEEEEEKSAYVKTELMYHQALSQEPHSALLLTNFAQFLYLVLHDHDRAEVYFRRAVRTMPAVDAEALSRYASFLWGARRDLGAAEEAYLEAIAADPGNAYHAASYANFLWSTGGGEDTCYPIIG